ncbi:PLP-dependent enzyme, histidinol-phosphate/aromatic aminotransferase or cobyric acid decarboxylase [Saccharomonospora marina XMU15]|uniref:histidinol-phosphate transaminase n=1 Tax=Saccharomonospora marina XMU15 TaxID=882083 RepID=H5X7S5_9PSEU|nr:histidinol-phosphate transaminase [Saccharomonospora marina]EHR51367.1 PLP-dependent enzyme, histidinol-phosphate/aromatic aminotransferase or cobyric acid decarboxylase [Saccharomonospora marina XMU15]
MSYLVRGIRGHQLTAASGPPQLGVVRLDRNENPYGPGSAARAALDGAMHEPHRYPEPAYQELTEGIARAHGVHVDRVAVGNGADELILLLALVHRTDPRSAQICEQTFQSYALSLTAAGVEFRELALRDWAVDVAAFVTGFAGGAGLAFVCNPHNPTGSLLGSSEVAALCAAARDNGAVLVLDEAYAEYAGPGFASALPWAAADAGVCILRTFSKAHGLAGLRIAYLIGDPSVVSAVRQVQRAIPFHVNGLGCAAALAAIGDIEHVARTVAATECAKSALIAGFERLGIAFLPSAANFVLVHLPGRAAAVAELLAQAGLAVRDVTELGLPDRLRITVGSQDQVDHLLYVLEGILADA